jgi:hypothetical protein
MRNLLLFVAFTVVFCSCKKENEPGDLKNEIAGTWELEKIICGLCTFPVINYPQGNGNTITLLPDGSYERKKQDTLLVKGTWSAINSKECSTAGDRAIIINEGSSATLMFIKISTDKLELSTPYCYTDYNATTYRRIK